jgi:cyclopropane fatty-acyl-phospholipid synthase-like methyltransferase
MRAFGGGQPRCVVLGKNATDRGTFAPHVVARWSATSRARRCSRSLRSRVVTGNQWEDFARQNAEYHILTSEDDHSTAEKRAAFFALGEADVRRILAEVEPYLRHRRHALEIGCGVGRLAIPMSKSFETVTAVDVAPTMLEKLAENCAEVGITNVAPSLPGAAWDAGDPVDLAYSRIVFQHIDDWRTISDYVRRVATCLAADGVCHFHFDTRPRTAGYLVRRFLPDAVLRRRWRTGLRRVRRSPAQVRELCERSGLRVIEEDGSGEEFHILILTKSA